MFVYVLFVCFGLHAVAAQTSSEAPVPCYDELNQPQRCQPPFVNAAYGKIVDSTNTCGISSETEYCLQTGATGARKYCYGCNNQDETRRHPASYLSDFNNNSNYTWWQSETMLEGIQFPNSVNLTLNLKKSFDITYVNLRFYSPRPESFAIYKKTREDGPWIPYQFYSASCELTYNLPRKGVITAQNEDQAICTNEFSDISPLTGGSVAFSTLEGRPSMFEFNQSPQLQEWVTATDLMIVLTRINTFGDEVFGDQQVLRSYFYAISDLAIGARCKCNGHAKECRPVRDQSLDDRLECVCEHNTGGQDCDVCLPFYNDQPWGRATEDSAHECQACNCNGLSSTCEFDPDLHQLTGHGGRCTNCRDNSAGVNCEICQENHYRGREDRCVNCGCNPTGSISLQCNEDGQCPCKPGVGGQRCDRCLPDFYDFGDKGCRPCACEIAGSLNNEPICDSTTGLCQCKENVDGRQCDKCKPGFFGLSEEDQFGCISCFCYGHSSECSAASGYYEANITSGFESGNQRWTAVTRSNDEVETQYNGLTLVLGVSSDSNEPVYFRAPRRYHGDHRFSYNQFITFDLRIGEDTARPSVVDIILEGSGKSISTHIFAQENPVPGVTTQSFAFRIHENPKYQWTPRLNAVDLIGILANISAVKIRATYNDKGVGFIDNIHLGTARQGFTQDSEEATNVESCTCGEGHVGQFCESCVPGYKREVQHGGPFSRCVPCTCNNHSNSCDVSSGKCICQDNTEGDFCEHCARGFYGDATLGMADDCTPCPCPDQSACIQLPNVDVVCTECADGYGGNLCDICLDGYYGDPTGQLTGTVTPCSKCTCNSNIDSNAVGNCNTTTGECLKCIGNTGGFYCEECLADFYNNTLGQCTACNCFPEGTVTTPGGRSCDVRTGQCLCQPHVIGRKCENSAPGYWNILGELGSDPCECDQKGSLNYTCDERTGQCQCKPGVSGRQCAKCADYHWGHSDAGCMPCNCDPVGSLSLQCDVNTGYCDCKPNTDGKNCDRCMENKYDLEAGCLDCPQCYNLVQRAVNSHRAKVRELTGVIFDASNNPSLFNDSAFLNNLQEVQKNVEGLLREARSASTGDGTVGQQLDDLKQSLQEVMDKCGIIARNIKSAERATADSQADVESAQEAIKRAEDALDVASQYIEDEGQQALKQALMALENFGQNSQQMTEIARQAASEAKKQTDQAKQIEDLATNALGTSREAQRLAREAMTMPGQTQGEIERLRREYDDASLLFQSTKMVANNTLRRAEETRDNAYDLLALAQQDLPDIELDRLKKDAGNIKQQAEDIKMRAAALVADNQDLMAKVRQQEGEAQGLLGEGHMLHQNLSNLLAEVDFARAQAREAVDKANKTLKEADDTLKTLTDFDKLTDNKDKADDALREVPAINATIQRAKEVTREARRALMGVEEDARKALELAKQAEAKAKEASQEAESIKKEAMTTKTNSEELLQNSDDLKSDVQMVQDTVDAYENQVAEDESEAEKALKSAAEAKQKAKDAYDQVSQVEQLLEKIKMQMDNMVTVGDPEMDALDALEKQLNMVEGQMNQQELDEDMEKLIQLRDDVKDQTDGFQDDLDALRKDVDNIQEIQAALPEQCFKNIPIESP